MLDIDRSLSDNTADDPRLPLPLAGGALEAGGIAPSPTPGGAALPGTSMGIGMLGKVSVVCWPAGLPADLDESAGMGAGGGTSWQRAITGQDAATMMIQARTCSFIYIVPAFAGSTFCLRPSIQ